MPGFIRRFRDVPPLEVITAIEGVIVTDEAPPAGLAAPGTGTVFLAGEFEDGPFAADADTDGGGIFQVFGTQGFLSRYGGFGYTYPDGPAQNPSARIHDGETWNGNGFIKMAGLQAPALMIGRVDTSVGEVSLSVSACLEATSPNPAPLINGQTMNVSVDGAAAITSVPVSAISAIVTGTGTPTLTFAGAPGSTLTVGTSSFSRDVVFSAADTTLTLIATRINNTMGVTVASEAAGQLVLTDPLLGTTSSVTLTNKSGTPGDIVGHIAAGATAATTLGAAGTFPTTLVGTFDVETTNVAATTVTYGIGDTAAVVAGLINTALSFTAATVVGGQLRLTDNETGELSTIKISAPTGGGAAHVGLVDVLQTNGTDPLGRTTTGSITNATGAVYPLAAGGDFDIVTDAIPGPTNVVYVIGDTAQAVAAKVNAAMGFKMAAVKADGQLRLSNNTAGATSSVTLAAGGGAGVAGVGLAAATVTGTGNVGNVGAVSPTEAAAILNDVTGPIAAVATASVTSGGLLRLCSDTVASGSIEVVAGPMQAALNLPTGEFTAAAHGGGIIPAGTRVKLASSGATGAVWVTMQTLTISDGDAGPYVVRVRPGLDDGTATGTGAGTVDTVVDQPAFGTLSVTNVSALSAALTESQIDSRYQAVLEKSLDKKEPTKIANYLLMARRTDTIVTLGRTNALSAEGKGLFGRKYITGSKLGTSPTDAIAEVASFRSDRVFYTTLGLQIYIPEIAAVGTAGGVGFTEDGNIIVRPDAALQTLCARLAPEENPGRETQFLTRFTKVETFGNPVTIDTYVAFRKAGIAAPILEDTGIMGFQSGVTSSLDPALINMSRRKMADFIQDTLAILAQPFVKRLNRQSERDALTTKVNNFCANLRSQDVPDLQRISDFSVDDGENAGNTRDTLAAGIFYVLTKVRLLSTMDFIVMRTQIGENVVIENAA